MQPKKDTPAKKEKAAKESKPQEKKEKKEKKKEEKKPAPEDDDDMDASEAALAAEPKAKDPFAHLPKRYKHFDGYLTRIYFKTQMLIEMVTLADENIHL